MKATTKAAIALTALFLAQASSVQAALIQGPSYISASTPIPTCGFICGGVGSNINQIADGDSSNLNGYAGADGVVGIITLDLLGDFDLESFSLWNDINVYHEGVGTFRLHFYDAFDNLLESAATLLAPNGQFAPQVYAFNSIVHGVSKVDLETLTLLTGGVCCRIEILEVAFNGEYASVSVPEPTSLALLGLGLASLGALRRRKLASVNSGR